MHVSKIIKLFDLVHEKLGASSVPDLAIACAAIVHAYYGRARRVNVLSRHRKYIEMIEKITGFSLNGGIEDAFKIRPEITIRDDNLYYRAVFDDEFDRLLDQTHEFVQSISSPDAEAIVDMIASMPRDVKSLQVIARGHGHEHLLEQIMSAPFINVTSNDEVTYPACFHDIMLEIREHVRRSTFTSTERCSCSFFLGNRKREIRSLNMVKIMPEQRYYISYKSKNIPVDGIIAALNEQCSNDVIKSFLVHNKFVDDNFALLSSKASIVASIDSMKRNFKSYVHQLPVNDAIEIASVACDMKRGISSNSLKNEMVKRGMMLPGTNPYKIYVVLSFMTSRKFLIDETVTATVDDIARAIENLETRRISSTP